MIVRGQLLSREGCLNRTEMGLYLGYQTGEAAEVSS